MSKPQSSAPPSPRYAVPDSVVAFLAASTAAGNGRSTVSVKDAPCPTCGQITLAFSALRGPPRTSGHIERRDFRVVVRCRLDSCPFDALTPGRFTLE